MKKAKKKDRLTLLGVLFIIIMYAFVNVVFYSLYTNSADLELTLAAGLVLTAFGMVFGTLAGVLLKAANNARRSGDYGSQHQMMMSVIGVAAFGGLPAVAALVMVFGTEKYSQGYWLGIGMFLSLGIGFICGAVLAPKE